MITARDVISAYSLLLGREPESKEVIDEKVDRCRYLDELVQEICGSAEFLMRKFRTTAAASDPYISDEEIEARFFVHPEPMLINWLRSLPEIQGMVEPSSAYISAALAQMQAREGYGGNIAEIGVYHGKYLAGLATTLRPNESAIAVDVFENQDLNADVTGYEELGCNDIHSLTEAAFVRSMATYCPESRVLILKRSSLDITVEDLMPDGGMVRFFSIDGGHTRDVFLNDLRLAEAALAPHGIVSIDDILNDDWPGIITGAVRYFDGSTKLRPVAFIRNKLLCAFEPFVDLYREALINIAPQSIKRRNIEFSNYTADQYGNGDDMYLFLGYCLNRPGFQGGRLV